MCAANDMIPNDALATWVTGLVELTVAACTAVAPLISPETAAATNRDFIECFIGHSSMVSGQDSTDYAGGGLYCTVYDSSSADKVTAFPAHFSAHL
jgi:hypothetical protein